MEGKEKKWRRKGVIAKRERGNSYSEGGRGKRRKRGKGMMRQGTILKRERGIV